MTKVCVEKKYDIEIFEVITPAVKEAVNRTKTKHIAVIGTETTIFSQAYSNEVSFIDNSINITEIACPLLVPIIEEGLQNSKILIEMILYQ